MVKNLISIWLSFLALCWFIIFSIDVYQSAETVEKIYDVLWVFVHMWGAKNILS